MVFISFAESFAGRPPFAGRAGASRFEACDRPFADQVAFKFGQSGENVETSRPAEERASIFSISDSKLIFRSPPNFGRAYPVSKR